MKRPSLLLLSLSTLALSCATARREPVTQPKLHDDEPRVVAPPEPPVAPAEPVAARPFAPTAPLTVVTLSTAKPIVSLRVAFRAGSIDDPPGKEGLTALTTQLMAEGGTRELTSAQLLEALYPLAGQLDSECDKELTVFSGRVHKDKLDRFLKLFTAVLLEPRFDVKDFERLKASALSSITNRLRGENDEELGKVVLDSLLYEGHPYRHAIGGTVKGLTSITLDDVKAHALKIFTQDRAIIAVAGPQEVRLGAALKAALQKLPATGAAPVVLPTAAGIKGQTVIVRRSTLSTAESFGFTTALRRGDADYAAVALAASYLGEHRQAHGLLYTELREKRGLNYGDYAYVEHFSQEGDAPIPRVNVPRTTQDISVWLRPVEPANGVFATRAALYFLQQLRTGPLPKERFESARGFLLGATRIWEQTDQRRLGYAIDSALYGTPKYLDGYREALKALTPEQVQAAASKYLAPGSFNFVYVTQDADGLLATLKSRAPTPISYPSPKATEITDVDQAISTSLLPLQSAAIKVIDASSVMEQ